MRRPQIAATVITVIQIPRLTRHDQAAGQNAVDLLRAQAVRSPRTPNLTPQHNRTPSAPNRLMPVPVAANVRRTARKSRIRPQRRKCASGGQRVCHPLKNWRNGCCCACAVKLFGSACVCLPILRRVVVIVVCRCFPSAVMASAGVGGRVAARPAAQALACLVADSSHGGRMSLCRRIQLDPLSGVRLSLLCGWVHFGPFGFRWRMTATATRMAAPISSSAVM
jgi:hypothetical protein